MITERDALEYECFGSWWTGYIGWDWLQAFLAKRIARKVSRKFARYQELKTKMQNGRGDL